MYEFFEAQKLDYVAGMAKNAWLTALAKPLMAVARSDFNAWQQTGRRHDEGVWQAWIWPHERRVFLEVAVAAHFGRKPKDNPCFVVTSLNTTPRRVCKAVYCARGDAGNRLKELDLGLQIDRASCVGFLANPLRVFMRAAAAPASTPIIRLRSRRTMPLLTSAGTVE